MKSWAYYALSLTLCTSLWAANSMEDYVGNWNDAAGWSEGRVPSGEEEVKVRGTTVCTLNTDTGDWGEGQRMRVYEGATLLVEDGAELLGAGWFRVGADGSSGTVIQSGGTVMVQDGADDAHLVIGDKANTQGYYTLNAGTITYSSAEDGRLIVGDRASSGTLTIAGSQGVVTMNDLIVCQQAGSTGTLVYQLDADGVSPITLDGDCTLDSEGADSNAFLVVEATAVPPQDEIVLIDLGVNGELEGSFDNVPEGNEVSVTYRGDTYVYTLTYHGGLDGMDIALVYSHLIPEPMNPGTGNLTHSYTFEDGTGDDLVGDADGILVGDTHIAEGLLILDGDGDSMDIDGSIVDINSYSGVTLELWAMQSVDNGYTMTASLGGTWDNGLGKDYLMIACGRGDQMNRGAVVNTTDDVEPWLEEVGISSDELNDGELHHYVLTVNATELSYYLDGVLIGTAALDGTRLSGLSNEFIYLGKGVYSVDGAWAGAIDSFQIYDRALSANEVAYQAGYRAEPYSPGDLDVIAHYPFTEGANDVSPNEYHGTFLGSPTFVYGPDDFGFAYRFHGMDSNDAVATGIAFAPDANFTVAYWVRGRGWKSDEINVMVADSPDGSQGLNLSEYAGTGLLSFQTAGLGTDADLDGTLVSQTELPHNEWIHVTAIYDAENAKKMIFLNGVLDMVGNVITDGLYVPSNLPLYLAAAPSIDGQETEGNFQGYLDEVMFYNRVLTTGEILYISNFVEEE